MDCKINAYPLAVATPQAPNFLFMDLDLEHFKSRLALNRTLDKTLQIINEEFETINSVVPTILWSGNGYHIYLPVMAVPLERQSINSKYWLAQKFAKQGWEEYPSREFIRFAEQHLTNKKADICHSKTLSFKNCMIRIPGSINSKSNELVTVVQKWNGIRHSIMPLLVDYYIHLASKKQKEISADNPITKRLGSILKTCHYRNGVIRWIEALLETSILENHRKYVIWRILAPYLINVKKMSYEDAYSTIRSWLGKCHSARRLDFNAKRRIDESLNKVIKNGNYLPISFSKLKLENPRLYELLCERNN